MRVETIFVPPSNDNISGEENLVFKTRYVTTPLGVIWYSSLDELEKSFVDLAKSVHNLSRACVLLQESREKLLTYVESLNEF